MLEIRLDAILRDTDDDYACTEAAIALCQLSSEIRALDKINRKKKLGITAGLFGGD